MINATDKSLSISVEDALVLIRQHIPSGYNRLMYDHNSNCWLLKSGSDEAEHTPITSTLREYLYRVRLEVKDAWQEAIFAHFSTMPGEEPDYIDAVNEINNDNRQRFGAERLFYGELVIYLDPQDAIATSNHATDSH